ncbi:MAG: PilZ domain-containing protein [Phycisphaerae bacterium]|jgi:hypothetical protein
MVKPCDIEQCLTEAELARLLEDAFATWQSQPPDQDGKRQTPRIAAGETKPIFVVGYAYAGAEVAIGERATILDISADGLGIALPRAVPVGATLHFAYASDTDECGYGTASVVRSIEEDDRFHVGLSFPESASTLEIEPAEDTDVTVPPRSNHASGFAPVRAGMRILGSLLARRGCIRRELRKAADGHEARLVLETKTFRFRSALYVDEQCVASHSGVLNDRFRNLYSTDAAPTPVRLEGGGFAAWGILQTQDVKWCVLDLSVDAKQALAQRTVEQQAKHSEPSGDQVDDNAFDNEGRVEANADAAVV